MLSLSPSTYENQMVVIFSGLIEDALYILTNTYCTPDDTYATYRALAHIYFQAYGRKDD